MHLAAELKGLETQILKRNKSTSTSSTRKKVCKCNLATYIVTIFLNIPLSYLSIPHRDKFFCSKQAFLESWEAMPALPQHESIFCSET